MRTTCSKSIVIAALLGLAATGGAQPPPKDASPAAPAADKPAAPAADKPAAKPPAKPSAKPGPTAKAEKPPAVDPEAIAALEQMGTFLREQRNFTVRTTTETDHVLDSGQKVRITARGDVRVRRPDHLRADTVSDLKARQYFYDGKTFTMNGPRLGYYASVPAPPTIGELADALEDRYGLQLPMVDLFRWGTAEADTDLITRAIFVGQSTIDGIETNHYAFRQPGLDWEIWIERGAHPLPRKLLLTTTDDPARPEHEIAMTWDLAAKHEDSLFTFVPSKDSQKIALAELPAPGNAAGAKPKRPSTR